jgi:hypothetical protein
MATTTRKAKRTAPRSKARPRRPAASSSEPPRRKAGGRPGAPASPVAPLPVPAVLLDATVEPDVVNVPARTVVAIDGAGPPEGEGFGRSVGALYGIAYGLKIGRKGRGASFKIGPLEGRWWAEGAPEGPRPPPREAWRWQLRLAVPADVRGGELAEVVRAATLRKGGKLEGSAEARRVLLARLPRATVGRILHLGPYADEPRSLARVDAALTAVRLEPARAHVEIYLSDPRRTPAARLRTVLLRETAPAAS